MPASPQAARKAPAPGASAGGYGFLVILLIGAVALGGLYMYSNSVRERDKLVVAADQGDGEVRRAVEAAKPKRSDSPVRRDAFLCL